MLNIFENGTIRCNKVYKLGFLYNILGKPLIFWVRLALANQESDLLTMVDV